MVTPRTTRSLPHAFAFLLALGSISAVSAQPLGSPDAGPAGAGGPAGQGGAANADFDSLIDLITSTIAADTWAENGGGEAEIRPFPSGVWMDAAGVIETTGVATSAPVGLSRRIASESSDARQPAELRVVSLPRLEAEILRRSVEGEALDEAMLTLAGLQRIEWVAATPPTDGAPGDLVVAGPAGDWRVDEQSRLVSVDTGQSVVRLDDLLTLLRREHQTPGEPFGCAITPRQEALAATQARLDATKDRPLAPGTRGEWLEGVRSTLGAQDIEVFGLDPSSNAARVLVEADHHMKQLGLGAAKGPEGLKSYLDRAAAAVRRGEPAQPLSVLRWWFAANYEACERSADGAAFHLRGQAVRVLSENELLTVRGERVHTGQSDAMTEGFARDFTQRFAELAVAYPVYSELRNVFDLAVVAAIVRSEAYISRAKWEPELFLAPGRLPTPRLRAAKQVDTMAVGRVVRRRHILAAVSGGVWIDASRVTESESPTRAQSPSALVAGANAGDWWWDVSRSGASTE